MFTKVNSQGEQFRLRMMDKETQVDKIENHKIDYKSLFSAIINSSLFANANPTVVSLNKVRWSTQGKVT